jgi:hypothetical protein
VWNSAPRVEPAAQVAADITDQTVVGGFQSLRNGLLEGRSDAEAGSGPAARLQPDHPPTSRTHQYDLLHLGATDLVACVGPCLIIISYTITLPGVEAIGRGFAKLTQRDKKACSLSIVERKSGPGTAPEARDAIAEIAKKYDKNMTGSAVVCDGTGFRATAVRSVVTAILMASRSSSPTKVFAAPEPALDWLQTTRPARDLDLAMLAQATTALRARLQEQMARAGVLSP